MEGAANSFGVTLRDAPCHDEAEIEAVIAGLAQRGGGGLLAIAEIFNQMHGKAIAALALKYKIPTNIGATEREAVLNHRLRLCNIIQPRSKFWQNGRTNPIAHFRAWELVRPSNKCGYGPGTAAYRSAVKLAQTA
jgi:hypothetical protein